MFTYRPLSRLNPDSLDSMSRHIDSAGLAGNTFAALSSGRSSLDNRRSRVFVLAFIQARMRNDRRLQGCRGTGKAAGKAHERLHALVLNVMMLVHLAEGIGLQSVACSQEGT